MRRIIACLVGLALLAPLAGRESLANGIRPYPQIPQRKTERVADGIPLYPITIGAAAVAMTGSLIALIIIRKRNGK